MGFNHTSCVNCQRGQGFTLVEFMIAMSIALVVIGAGLALWAYASKTSAALFSYVDLSSSSKNAMDRISQQIRNARSVQSCTATQLVLVQLDGKTNILGYSAGTKKVTSTVTDITTTLLTDCTSFGFSAYQRTPTSNSTDLLTYTNGVTTNAVKAVKMQWIARRKLTGNKDNIESQASARIVIRNP